MGKKVDPVLLEVIKNGFDTIADEMTLIILRTAYSAIVRDTMDYSTAICDARGLTLAQGLTTPLHLGGFYDAMQRIIRQYEGKVGPEDIFIGNDPYVADGQHLPDIYIVLPIFIDDVLEGWATTVAHHCDVGGIVPGSNALGATEIYQEGLRIPFVKLYDDGTLNQAVWDIIATNVRVPDLVLGDLHAQTVACHIGAREYRDMFARHGAKTMHFYIDELFDYAEALARSEFAAMPDGTYEFTDHIDGLGENPEIILFHVTLTVKGDEVLVDWTGSSPQVKGGVNCAFPFTKAATYTPLRSIMGSDMPNCHGFTRPITITAPKGTVTNAVPPGACGARGVSGFRMIDCLFGALAQVVPEKVPADSCGGSSLPTLAGYREGKAFVMSETLLGTWGGTAHHDGQEGVPHMGANQSNVPIELIEIDYPVCIERYGFLPDTGGPGQHRGGLSIIREYRAVDDDVTLTLRSDKRAHPPHGLFGGGPGGPSWSIINPGTEDRILPVLLTKPEILNRGDVFRHIKAGGGGYGNPLERDPEAVLADVMVEKVTPGHAAEAYGVIVVGDVENGFTIDREATERRRQAMEKEAHP
jgi:N-methylhydantoinase B